MEVRVSKKEAYLMLVEPEHFLDVLEQIFRVETGVRLFAPARRFSDLKHRARTIKPLGRLHNREKVYRHFRAIANIRKEPVTFSDRNGFTVIEAGETIIKEIGNADEAEILYNRFHTLQENPRYWIRTLTAEVTKMAGKKYAEIWILLQRKKWKNLEEGYRHWMERRGIEISDHELPIRKKDRIDFYHNKLVYHLYKEYPVASIRETIRKIMNYMPLELFSIPNMEGGHV